MGWESTVPDFPWVVPPPGSKAEAKAQCDLVDAADIALIGASPWQMRLRRSRTGKLTFFAAERMWKKPLRRGQFHNPGFLGRLWMQRLITNRPSAHHLPIGTFAAYDARAVGLFGDRHWKWGYFIEVPQTPPAPRPHRPIQVLWAGRMLDWKRVDTLIGAVAILQREAAFGGITVVGDGPEKPRLLRLAEELGVMQSGKCKFTGSVPFKDVLCMMRDHDVYVLPSDRNEGWGVVANEAMSYGCALIANEQAGSARMMIRDGETGLLFADGDQQSLATSLRTLMNNPNLAAEMRLKAWRHVRDIWSPTTAAKRLLKLADSLENKVSPPYFDDGPCIRE